MTDLSPRNRKDRKWRDLTLLIFLVLLSSLPFLNRAIHLDENTYLALARNVSSHFWFPQDLNGLWFGIPVLNFSGHTHPVGLAYYLAMLLKITPQGAEWPLRLGFLVFPLGYVVAGYYLAARFTKHPFWTAALMMATPAVLVFSPTLMPDLPMSTFWLLAVLSFLAGQDDRKPWKLILTAFFLICATLISYQAIFMSVLLAVYAWIRGDRRGGVVLCFASPIVFLAIYWYAGYLHYGFFAAEQSRKYLSIANIFGLEYFRQKVLGMLTTLGATTVFSFSLLWVFGRAVGWKKFSIVVLMTAVACLFVPKDYTPFEYAEFCLFALTGTMALWFMTGTLARDLKKLMSGDPSKTGDLFLTLWVLGVALYTVLLSEFTAARYIAPLVPPLAICFVKRVEEFSQRDERGWRRFLVGTTLATWFLAAGIAYADSQYVGSYREFSRWFSGKYTQPGGAVWVGSEAGLRYYMEGVGAHPLVNGYSPVLSGVLPGSAWGEFHFGKPAVNDLLVRPSSFLRYDLAPDLELSATIDSRRLSSSFPVRTYGPAAHAGLHGTNVGLLPFAISSVPLDQIDVYRYTVFAYGFKDAIASAFPKNEIQETFMTMSGERRTVIVMPSSARLPYSVIVPKGSMLSGEVAIDNTSPSCSNCKVELFVSVRSGNDSIKAPCGEVILYPRRSARDEPTAPIRFSCEMSAFGDQRIDAIFETKNDSDSNPSGPRVGLWNLQWIQGPPLGLP
ncbi:MAG: glycosyltransferase family 39 protein [Acidobacteriia bacterium]|nr:glycosyltransferase family 39 protein [Terriglobia bacterium]